METSFSPVQYIYREIIEEEIAKQTEGKIFFFDVSGKVDSLDGKVIQLREIQGEGLFIMMDSGAKVRIDRIITLFGKPGAAFDEYDSYANQCLSCTGGYDL
jgi:hypothetical protein